MIRQTRLLGVTLGRNCCSSIVGVRSISTENGAPTMPKKDIDVIGINQGLIHSDHDRAFHHFFHLCEKGKSDLVSHNQLSGLLKEIRLPLSYRNISYDASRSMGQKVSLILKVMKSCDYILDESDLRSLLSIYGTLGKFDLSAETWVKLKQTYPYPELQSYTALFMSLKRSGNFKRVISTHDEVLKSGLRLNRNYLQCVMEAFGELGEGERVLEIYQNILALPEVSLNKDFFLVTIASILKCAPTYFDSIPQIFDMMLQNRFPLSEKNFQSVIRNYAHHGLIDESIYWFQKLREYGITPTISVFLRYLAKFSESNFPERLVPLLTEAEFELLLNLQHSVHLRWLRSPPGMIPVTDNTEAFFTRLRSIREKAVSTLKAKNGKSCHSNGRHVGDEKHSVHA